MKKPAWFAILVYGLLALLATPAAEADPPNLPVSGVPAAVTGPIEAPGVPLPASVDPGEVVASLPAAESVVEPSTGKPPAASGAPAVPALDPATVESAPNSSGNPANDVPATSSATEAVAPAATLDRKPPRNVQGLSAKAGDRAVTLRWSPPKDTDFNHVVISRTSQAAGPAGTSVYSGRAKRFVDRGLTNGVAYRYVIVSYDLTGNRSAGAAIVAAPKALMLVHPSDGAQVKAPPLLRWVWIPGATYYNVQLFRGPMRIKVMTAWPATNRLQLASAWVHAARRRQLVPGVYRWIVWPGFGRQIAKRYGPLLGEGTFSVVAGKGTCVVARGGACSQALAVDTSRTAPPTRPPAPAASESPLATAPGPVVTVASPSDTTVAAAEPDVLPVQGKRAGGPEPAAPARTPALAARAVSVRRTAQASNWRGRAPASTRRVAQAPAVGLISASAEKLQPVPSFAPRAAPSGIKQGLAKLRWFFLAILGTALVFLAAVGSRRLSEMRQRRTPSLRWSPQAAPRSARNGTIQKTAIDSPELVLSRRRCLVPGCHHDDELSVER